MLEIIKKINIKNYNSNEIRTLLIQKFDLRDNNLELNTYNYFIKELNRKIDFKNFKDFFDNNFPTEPVEILLFIYVNSSVYSYINYRGIIAHNHIWPKFFTEFPKGEIWLLQISNEWYNEIIKWETYSINPLKESSHQIESNIGVENFPYLALNFSSISIYPIIMGLYSFIRDDIIFLYIPDKILEYSQIENKLSPFEMLINYNLPIFDDVWHHSRGVKIKAQIMPTNNLKFIEWSISQIRNRMKDICSITDIETQFKKSNTINRALIDGFISITSGIPYISKNFFFSTIDKLANFLSATRNEERKIWELFFNLDYLSIFVNDFIQEIPEEIQIYFKNLLSYLIEEFEIENITPALLKAYRNSIHGYDLQKDNLDLLINHSGHINNDITLIVTPLIYYIVQISWIGNNNLVLNTNVHKHLIEETRVLIGVEFIRHEFLKSEGKINEELIKELSSNSTAIRNFIINELKKITNLFSIKKRYNTNPIKQIDMILRAISPIHCKHPFTISYFWEIFNYVCNIKIGKDLTSILTDESIIWEEKKIKLSQCILETPQGWVKEINPKNVPVTSALDYFNKMDSKSKLNAYKKSIEHSKPDDKYSRVIAVELSDSRFLVNDGNRRIINLIENLAKKGGKDPDVFIWSGTRFGNPKNLYDYQNFDIE